MAKNKKEKTRGFHLLIPAAGSGTRMGQGLPKQYRKICGKTVLRHTIERFFRIPGLESVRVIIDPAHADLYHDAVKGLDIAPFIPGGKTRKESVYNGINAIPDLKNEDLILIHDAARPLVSREDIGALLAKLESARAVTLAVPVTDTLRRSSNETVDRRGLWAIQTPQGFQAGPLLKAHEQCKGDGSFTDDAGLASAAGIEVAIVEGSARNFKITTEEDFNMAETLLRAQTQTRSAQGFDVHAFAAGKAASIRLGGIDIPSDRALKGHSDADVALHALTDALLGTIAAGDIGTHFPPSDPQWAGAESAVFLQHAARLMAEKGGEIRNLDLTLIAEEPKIGPYRAAMQARIAALLDIPADKVSVKATTTEGLGFTGRKEGIAAQAIATISLSVEG